MLVVLNAVTLAWAAGRYPGRVILLAPLIACYTLAAERHNALGLTGPLDPAPRGYHDRPFLVIDAGRFATALRAGMTDPEVRRLPTVGGVDQFVDSTDVLSHAGRARAAAAAMIGTTSRK